MKICSVGARRRDRCHEAERCFARLFERAKETEHNSFRCCLTQLEWNVFRISVLNLKLGLSNRAGGGGLTVFDNSIQRRIFGHKKDEVTGEWRRLHNKELRDLYK